MLDNKRKILYSHTLIALFGIDCLGRDTDICTCNDALCNIYGFKVQFNFSPALILHNASETVIVTAIFISMILLEYFKDYVETNYGWNAIVAQYIRHYEKMIH